MEFLLFIQLCVHAVHMVQLNAKRLKYIYITCVENICINVILILYGLLNLYIAFYFKWILNEFIFIKIFYGIFHNPLDLSIQICVHVVKLFFLILNLIFQYSTCILIYTFDIYFN